MEISEIKPSIETNETRIALEKLEREYDLKPFLYTTKINIERRVIPHSHPILTLNTRHRKTPHELLSALLHEEAHWFLTGKETAASAAIEDFKKIYPKIPATPSAIAESEYSTYLHLIVCWIEYQSLKSYIGDQDARKVLEITPFYTWIYSKILGEDEKIAAVLKKHRLIPDPLQ